MAACIAKQTKILGQILRLYRVLLTVKCVYGHSEVIPDFRQRSIWKRIVMGAKWSDIGTSVH